jgi:hypothetical protein
VIDDVPDYAVVVGVPAKVVSYDGSAGYVIWTDYDMGEDCRGLTRAVREHQVDLDPGVEKSADASETCSAHVAHGKAGVLKKLKEG